MAGGQARRRLSGRATMGAWSQPGSILPIMNSKLLMPLASPQATGSALSDDVAEYQGTPGVLVRLAKVEGGTLSVDPDSFGSADDIRWDEASINPKVRRWDHFANEDVELEADGSILIKETPVGTLDEAATANSIHLKDGIQVQFAEGGDYRTGDLFVLIPARVETGGIEWPEPQSDASGTLTAHLAPRGSPITSLLLGSLVGQTKRCRSRVAIANLSH